MMNKRVVNRKVRCRFVEHGIQKPLEQLARTIRERKCFKLFERFECRPVVNKGPPFRLFIACADTQSHSFWWYMAFLSLFEVHPFRDGTDSNMRIFLRIIDEQDETTKVAVCVDGCAFVYKRQAGHPIEDKFDEYLSRGSAMVPRGVALAKP